MHAMRWRPATEAEVVTVVGASARESFDFTHFHIGQVKGWQRSFCQANWVNLVCGDVCVRTKEVAALAMVPSTEDYVSHVALLDVTPEELPGYRIVRVLFCIAGADGSILEEGQALMCAACDDDAEADRLRAPDGELTRCCDDTGYVR
ncbi:unnamed protein product, partial [Symbiodinium pilosum]